MTDRFRIEQKIGFDRVRMLVESRCSTMRAKERCAQFGWMSDVAKIEKELSLSDEMREILMLENSFPQDGYVDTIPFLKRLEIDSSYLDLPSIIKLRSSLELSRGIVNFFKESKEGRYPFLKELVKEVVLFPEVTRRVDVIVDRFGEIRDNASPVLSEIRRELKSKEGQISRKIASILKKVQGEGLADEDSSVVIRDGRMLIPVSSANKKRVPGFVYDESASGKTSYIEPMEIVELNNQVKELYFAEQREILRILVEFSDFLRPYLDELLRAAYVICELDFIRGKASVSVAMQAGKPVISSYGELNLVRARHPLLEAALKKEGKEIVPLSLKLNRDKRILLISGPNAGGKSVCLKCVGLLQYMFQSGMLIPASESSELPVFESLFIDIGDEQSIENDLSTYSSHLNNMKEILSGAKDSSLVLIDEFGAGTEPTAGGAIAEAILQKIEERGCYGVINTHYSNLKFYASSSKGVINGGMQFDAVNIRPLFKLEIGVPGSSFAFELARKIGLPEGVVKEAEERAGSDFVDLEKHLKKIAKNRRQWEERLARIKSTDKTLESITDKYQKELGDIQKLRKGILDEAKDEAKRILSEANKKIEATIKEIRESQAEKEKTKIVRKELDRFAEESLKINPEADERIAKKMEQLKRRQEKKEKRRQEGASGEKNGQNMALQKPKIADNVIMVGDKVRIKGGDLAGEVIRVDDKDVSVAVGNIISVVGIKKVEKISNKEFSTSFKAQPKKGNFDSLGVSERKLNFKPTIDIRGQRLDEAIDSVSRFIDDAIMLDMNEVKILHGKGNGILREEIRKYLKITGGVKSFRDEHIQYGGSGITIVELG